MKTYILVAALLAATPAAAATYQFNATSYAPANLSDFSLTFQDLNNDGLLNTGEVVSFSGFTSFPGTSSALSYSLLTGVGGSSLSTGGTRWSFSDGTNTRQVGSSDFSYAITSLTAVPLPASLGLLGGALALMGAAARRRKS